MQTVFGMAIATIRGDIAGHEILEEQAPTDPKHFVVAAMGTLERLHPAGRASTADIQRTSFRDDDAGGD